MVLLWSPFLLLIGFRFPAVPYGRKQNQSGHRLMDLAGFQFTVLLSTLKELVEALYGWLLPAIQ